MSVMRKAKELCSLSCNGTVRKAYRVKIGACRKWSNWYRAADGTLDEALDVVDNGRTAPLRGDGWLDPAHDTERGGLERRPCVRGDRGGVRVRQRMLELGHERHRALVDVDHGRWKPPAPTTSPEARSERRWRRRRKLGATRENRWRRRGKDSTDKQLKVDARVRQR